MLKRAVKKEEENTQSPNWKFTDKVSPSDNFGRFKKNKTAIIVVGIIILLIVVSSFSNNSSNNSNSNSNYSNTKDYCPNGDSSPSYYDNNCGTETTCLGNDGYNHSKVANSNCDNGSTPLGWSCKSGYSPKSEGKRTRDNDSWYCECNLSQVRCPSYADTKSDSMQLEINREQNYLDSMYVNQYSQSSVNNYNTQVQKLNNLVSKRNRYMSENCDCSY